MGKNAKINGQRPCHFIGDLKTASLDDSKWEILLESFRWEYGADAPITTPAGLISDGGPSVPPEHVFLAGGLVFGAVVGLLLWIFLVPSLFFFGLTVISGGVLGIYTRWMIRPEKFKIVGYLHDWLRNFLTTGNATTDAMLRDAAYWNRPDKISPFGAWLIYLGVRIGTHTGFKSEPPESVIEDGIRVFAEHLGVNPDQLEFVTELSLVRIKETPIK